MPKQLKRMIVYNFTITIKLNVNVLSGPNVYKLVSKLLSFEKLKYFLFENDQIMCRVEFYVYRSLLIHYT